MPQLIHSSSSPEMFGQTASGMPRNRMLDCQNKGIAAGEATIRDIVRATLDTREEPTFGLVWLADKRRERRENRGPFRGRIARLRANAREPPYRSSNTRRRIRSEGNCISPASVAGGVCNSIETIQRSRLLATMAVHRCVWSYRSPYLLAAFTDRQCLQIGQRKLDSWMIWKLGHLLVSDIDDLWMKAVIMLLES